MVLLADILPTLGRKYGQNIASAVGQLILGQPPRLSCQRFYRFMSDLSWQIFSANGPSMPSQLRLARRQQLNVRILIELLGRLPIKIYDILRNSVSASETCSGLPPLTISSKALLAESLSPMSM